mgnify:CR=1 FL=1
MARFTLPRDLYFGKGSMETLKTLVPETTLRYFEGLIKNNKDQ